MNAFEKIKETLEEEKHPEQFGGWETIRIDRAIEIVNQVAEEYSSKSSSSENDGWIPCSSGILPDGDGYEYYDPEEDMIYYRQVLVHTNEADIPYCVAYYDTDTWFCAVTGTPLVVDRWKLIEPYQPKGEK